MVFIEKGDDMMICRSCGGKTKVVDSRKFLGGRYIRRKRICEECNKEYFTFEVLRDEFYSLKLGTDVFKKENLDEENY